MYKLVILIEAQEDMAGFDTRWPQFLALAEKMPGLRHEVTSHVDRVLHGNFQVHLMHELFFDSLKSATEAMASIEGGAAGQVLQDISAGKVTLLLADHAQDDLAHIRRHAENQNTPPGNRA